MHEKQKIIPKINLYSPNDGEIFVEIKLNISQNLITTK